MYNKLQAKLALVQNALDRFFDRPPYICFLIGAALFLPVIGLAVITGAFRIPIDGHDYGFGHKWNWTIMGLIGVPALFALLANTWQLARQAALRLEKPEVLQVSDEDRIELPPVI